MKTRLIENRKYIIGTQKELIKDVTSIVEDINKTLKRNNEKIITAIQLERMIYLSSTGRFYLHKNSSHKESFLNRIKG